MSLEIEVDSREGVAKRDGYTIENCVCSKRNMGLFGEDEFQPACCILFRENNMGADRLANLACPFECKKLYHCFSGLPQSRGILNVDRLGIPNFRCERL